ncbi:MAG: alpha-glucosidase [Bacteroidetes bacterium]|nr:alpha-glucosidase [Bacteroidota bacterium]
MSFFDSNGDGYGDLKGIILKLDYLVDLGIDAIWLSPIYESPFQDFGYDISNYQAIDPRLGNMDDFLQLLTEAHERNIRVILDLVMNHTSEQHSWFIESSASHDNPKRDWYLWHPGENKSVPNNWKSAVGGSAWKLNSETGHFYYHSFFSFQPDLNWRNKDMQKEFLEQVRFWLDLGVDGFRLDVINMVVKDKKLRNSPLFSGFPFIQSKTYTRNRPKSYKIVRKLRKLVDKYNDRMLVGEIYTLPPGDPFISASYIGRKNKLLHLSFDFSIFFRPWSAKQYLKCISSWYWNLSTTGWPSIVFSNHDLNRYINRGSFTLFPDKKARLIAVMLLTLRGTPFLYYGDEIGMRNTKIPRRELIDPIGRKYWPFYVGRDRSRTPMQWNTEKYAGFSDNRPWLRINKDYIMRNVKLQTNEQDSLLNYYRRLIDLRKGNQALQFGEWMPLFHETRDVMAYMRIFEDTRFLIILNFSFLSKMIRLEENQKLTRIHSSHDSRPYIFEGSVISLLPFEACIYSL